MAEATIELPVIPPKAAATPTAEPKVTPAPNEPSTSPMAQLFDDAVQRSSGGGLMGTESKKAPEPTPAPAAEPTKPDAQKPAPPPAAGEFELPPEITGAPEPTPARKEPTVDEIMPEEPPASIKSEKDRANWKVYRGHQKHLETELAEARKQLEAKPPPVDQDTKALIAQYEERFTVMSEALERAGIHMHPAFNEQFTQPIAHAKESATQVLKDVGIDSNILDRVFQSKGKERIEAMDELGETITSQTVRMKILAKIEEIERLEERQQAALNDRQNWLQNEDQKLRAKRHQEGQQQVTQIRGMVDQAVEGLAKAGFTIFNKIDGNEKWNGQRDGWVESAKKSLTETTDPMELAGRSALGQVAPVIWQALLSTQKRLRAAEKELSEMGGALPSLDGNGGGAGAPVTEVEEPDRMKKLFSGALDTKFSVG